MYNYNISNMQRNPNSVYFYRECELQFYMDNLVKYNSGDNDIKITAVLNDGKKYSLRYRVPGDTIADRKLYCNLFWKEFEDAEIEVTDDEVVFSIPQTQFINRPPFSTDSLVIRIPVESMH